MAIYRGPGGAGDATGDATNASALALAARDEAIAAAAAAASSETAAGNSATDADASADASAVSASNAATSAGAASTFATNASNSATAASSSAATANTKASQASTSATAAASSAAAASTSASNASTSATNAASSASTASTQAANASNSASSAATSATNAASSATAASSSASDAAASAALINDSLLVHKATDETITGTKTFTANQIISVTDNTDAALRITQLGTGNALLVEDASNPDSSPFVINAAGSVGVGTSSPSVPLHVSKGAAGDEVARFTNAGGFGLRIIPQIGGSGSVTALRVAGGESMSFETNSTERMRIGSSGNLLVGTTSGSYKVEVAGDVNITGDFYKNGTIFSGGAKGGGSDAVFYENNQTVTTNYTITSGNNAMSAGPITVSSGVTVTVPSGSVWTIV